MKKNIESYVKIYDGVLSDKECKKTVKQLKHLNWETHSYYNYDLGKKISYDNELSVSADDFEMKEIISERIWKALKDYVDWLGFSWYDGWAGYTLPRFNKYDKKTLMRIHCDHIQSIFDGQRKGVPTLTVLGGLNNNYEGGELVMFKDKEVALPAGSMMVFPSNFLYPHEVKPVKSGTRYSYVSWVW